MTRPSTAATAEQDNFLRRVTQQIHQAQAEQDILTATAAEVRAFLAIDRVKIYQFHADGSGKVVAESRLEGRLPALLGLNFPADDIPPDARQLFIQARSRSIVDIDAQQIGQSGQQPDAIGKLNFSDFRYRPVDSCYVEYLTALGVKAALVIPICVESELWGLLVAHHAEPWQVPETQLQDVQFVADQLAVAIAQANLIAQARQKADREATVNRVSILLHALSTVQLQAALEETVEALQGCGGRLYLKTDGLTFDNDFAQQLMAQSTTSVSSVKLYTTGQQPAVPPQPPAILWEEYSVWQTYFRFGQRSSWAINTLEKEGRLRGLQPVFQTTKICGVLMLPLWYRQELIGFLSIFRQATDTEILWAGAVENDQRLVRPQLSFEVWKESRKAQAQPWTKADIALAETLANHFATAIQQYETHQQLQLLNANLERQVADRTLKFQQQTAQLTQALQDLQQAQMQLVHTEKMSSLGELVAGVAHEINNPVNFIYGNLKHVDQYTQDLLNLVALYQQAFPDPGEVIVTEAEAIDLPFLTLDLPKTLSSMRIGADRIRQIVLSLRNFSRLDQTTMAASDIHIGIDSTILILQHRLKATTIRIDDVEYDRAGIELVRDYGDLPLVECYAGQLNQVFMNLLSNAIDALEEDSLSCAIAEATADKIPSGEDTWIQGAQKIAEIRITTKAMGSNRVVIGIADNGPGISESVRSQIFAPFFTTKPIGKGTGMGLSISHQIITEKHGGTLRCESQPGQGTQFWMELPVSTAPAIAPAAEQTDGVAESHASLALG
jgi:signal transduction histidine kinase